MAQVRKCSHGSDMAVAAGPYHTVLLKSNGTVAACGFNSVGQCDIPVLSDGDGQTVQQVAAGGYCTVMLRSDGSVAACGRSLSETCGLPPSVGESTYTQVDAG